MAGVTKNGILQTNNTGGGGGGTNVTIDGPFPLPVEIQVPLPLEVDIISSVPLTVAVSNLPAVQPVSATDLDIRNLEFANDKVDASGSSVKVQDGLANNINSALVSAGSLPGANRGLLVDSVNYIRNEDSTVTAWAGSTAYQASASNPHPWVKAMRSSILSGDTTINALSAFLAVNLQDRSLESVAFFLRNSSLVGTLQFIPSPGGNNTSMRVYNTRTGAWETGTIIDPTLDTLYIIPCSGLAAVQILCTAYTSGQITAQYSGGPGVGALYADVSGSIVDTELPAAVALADNTSNPTVPGVGAFGMMYDGATWDRLRGTSADGLLVNLGSNNDVVSTPAANTPVSGTIDGVTSFLSIPILSGYNSVALTLINLGSFIGTLSFTDSNGAPFFLFNLETGKWVSSITDPPIIVHFSAPVLALNSLIGTNVVVSRTAYTSGSLTAYLVHSLSQPYSYALSKAELHESPLDVVVTSMPPVAAESSAVVVEPEESEEYTLNDTEALTQTIQGFLRVMAGALVSDVPKSYIEGQVQPLSVNSEGRLRTSTVEARTLKAEDFTISVDYTSNPYEYRQSAW